MSFRDDMNALYARAESLERDLERAQAELAEMRAAANGPSVRPRAAEPAPPGRARMQPPFAPPAAVPAFLESATLDTLDEIHARREPPALHAVHEYEDAIGRAVELLMPELIARHRGVRGDGTHEQLLVIMDVLLTLWRDHAAGVPTEEKQWAYVDGIVQQWAEHNELRRALIQIGSYRARAR